MKVQVKKGDPAAFRGEAIVVCHFEDSKKARRGSLSARSKLEKVFSAR